MRWRNKPEAAPARRRTEWQTIQTAAAGLEIPGPMDPIQSFRVMRIEERVLVDLAGLKFDTSKPGLATLGVLPSWAVPVFPNQYYWVNDSPTSIHPSVCSTYAGGTMYWNYQVLQGQMSVTRPDQLNGGFEFTTTRAFPKELLT